MSRSVGCVVVSPPLTECIVVVSLPLTECVVVVSLPLTECSVASHHCHTYRHGGERDCAGGLRVPGPEVLRLLASLRPSLTLARGLTMLMHRSRFIFSLDPRQASRGDVQS